MLKIICCSVLVHYNIVQFSMFYSKLSMAHGRLWMHRMDSDIEREWLSIFWGFLKVRWLLSCLTWSFKEGTALSMENFFPKGQYHAESCIAWGLDNSCNFLLCSAMKLYQNNSALLVNVTRPDQSVNQKVALATAERQLQARARLVASFLESFPHHRYSSDMFVPMITATRIALDINWI